VAEDDVTTPPDCPARIRDYLVTVTDVYRTHNVAEILADLLTPDIEFVDHRPLGADPVVGTEAAGGWLETLFEMMPDWQIRVEVLDHHGDDAYLARDSYSGEGSDTIGAAETEWYVVDVLRGDRLAREDIYEDESAAREHFERLRSGAAPR
jgi:hypothetical protein